MRPPRQLKLSFSNQKRSMIYNQLTFSCKTAKSIIIKAL